MPNVTTGTEWRDSHAHPQEGSLPAGRSWWSALAADRLTAIFGLWLAVAVIYWPSSVALDGIWRGSAGNAYTHGYLILIAALWLIVRDRERLRATPVRPVGWAWVLVVMLSAAWLWAWRADIQAVHVLLLPAILLLALAVALGWRMARICLFPAGLLIFAMPIWGPINHGLQTASAHLNWALVSLSGMPVYMQGDLIRLPAGTIEIAQACAGLNDFVIGLTVGALYGELVRDSFRRRIVWLGLMGLLGLLSNALRIFVVTVAAYETQMRSSLVAHHIWLGWCLFAIATGVFLAIAGRLGNLWDRAGSRKGKKPAAMVVPRPSAPGVPTGVSAVPIVVTLVCLGLLPALSYGMDFARSEAHSSLSIRWPEAPPGWKGPMPDTLGEWSPFFVKPSAESLRQYVDSRAEPVEVFAAAYRAQTQDAKLLGYRNEVLGSAGRLQMRSQEIVDSPAGRWRETVAVDATGARSLIWWRYRIGNRVFIEPRLSQLWYGLEALTGRPPVSSVTALRLACSTDCSAARARLASIVARIQPVAILRPTAGDTKAR
ncbi:MAG: exosortase [Steroidobacteraceae bacterium]